MKNNKNDDSNTKDNSKVLLLLIIGAILVVIGLMVILTTYIRPNFLYNRGLGNVDSDILVQIDYEDLTDDDLYITKDRRKYKKGSMQLIIPSIDVNTKVGSDTIPEALKEMPGLGNVNVSIAGHRDIHDMVFYSLDKVQEGDYLYLVYENLIFRYLYFKSEVIEPNNWDVIKRQGYSALTLTTCEPIGTFKDRLIVVGELEAIFDYTEDFNYKANDQQ